MIVKTDIKTKIIANPYVVDLLRYPSKASFSLRLRQIDPVLSKFGRSLGELPPALGPFFGRRSGIDYLFDRFRGELLGA